MITKEGYEAYKTKKKKSLENYDVYKAYRDSSPETLNQDLQVFYNTYANDYLSSWHSSDDLGRFYNDLSSLNDRMRAYRNYIGVYGTDDQKATLGDIDKALNGYSGVLAGKDNVIKQYGSFQSADEYNAAVKAYQDEQNFINNYDLEGGNKRLSELDSLIAQLRRKKASSYREGTRSAQDNKNYQKQIEELVSEREALAGDIRKVETARAKEGYYSLPDNSDFGEFSAQYIIPFEGQSWIDTVRSSKHSSLINITSKSDPSSEYYYMTDEERQIFNYLNNTEGIDSARKFLDTIQGDLISRQSGKAFDFAEDHPIIGSLISIPTQIMSGVDFITNIGTGRQSTNANISSSLRAGVSERIDNPIGEFIYNTSMSGVDSVLAALLPGGAGAGMLALSAASQSSNDILARGGTAGQAAVGGIASGIFEAFFERYSIANLKSMDLKKITTSWKDFIGNMGKQMITNAAEEGLTEIANITFDTMAMGDISNYVQTVEQYMSEGMSESDARWKAAGNFGLQIAESAASGALMGLGFGAGGAAIGGVKRAVEGKKVINANTKKGEMTLDELITASDGLFNGEYADNAKYDDARTLLESVKNNLSKQDPAQANRIAKLEELYMTESNKNAPTWAEQKKAIAEAAVEDVSETVKAAEGAAQNVTVDREFADVKYSSPLKIADYGGMTADKITVETENGERVTLDSLSFEDAELGELYSLATTLGSVEAANSFIENWDGQTEPSVYWAEWQKFENRGQLYPAAYEQTSRELGTSFLSEVQRLAAFKSGVSLYEREISARKAKIDKAVEEYKKGASERTEAKFDGKEAKKQWDSLNKTQREYYNFLKVVQSALGVNVRVFVSERGSRKDTENGSYDRSTNTLSIDLNAGMDDRSNFEAVKSCLLYTVSHESLHAMAVNNPEKYAVLRDTVLKLLTEKEGHEWVEERIAARMEELGEEELKDPVEAREKAIEEVVARACEDMFATSKKIQELFERVARENESVAKTFMDTVKNVIKRIGRLFKSFADRDVRSRSEEAMSVSEMSTEAIAEIQRLFEDGILSGIEASKAHSAVANRDTKDTDGVMKQARDKSKITIGMSDIERSEILKNKNIVAPTYQGQADEIISVNKKDLESQKLGLIKAALTKVGDEFGVFTDYDIKDVDVKITLSKTNLKESISKDVSPIQLAKLLPVLRDTVENAVGVESHSNRYYYDTDTVYFDNLLGGYVDGSSFIPVRFGLKHSKMGTTVLYVVVDQNKVNLENLVEIKNDRDRKDATPDLTGDSNLLSSVTYSVSQIIQFVNSKDLLRYLPDNMLTTEQKRIKWAGIAETIKGIDEKNDKKYKDFISSGNLRAAQEMINAKARANGYTIKAYHGTTNQEEHSVWNEERKMWETTYSPITVFKRQYDEQVGHFFSSDLDNAGGYGSYVYSVFLMMKKPFVIDCEGQAYNNISFDGKEMDTYEWADYARKRGYDGVVFKNIRDGVGFDDLSRPTTDYVIFDSNRIKSAETITYDKDGNIIPISKRFDVLTRDIRYQKRENTQSNREILANALMSTARTPEEKGKLSAYKDKIKEIEGYEDRLKEIEGETYYINHLGDIGERDRERLKSLREEREGLEAKLKRADSRLLQIESAKPLRELLTREIRRNVSKTAKEVGDRAREASRQRTENMQKAQYVERITKKAKQMRDTLIKNSPKKHVPDAIKEPIAKLLDSIDFSSKQLLRTDEPTLKDISMSQAMREVGGMLTGIRKGTITLDGFLDLPDGFSEAFSELTGRVSALVEKFGTKNVLNEMSLEELQVLNEVLYTIQRSITQANSLISNARYKHASEAALESIEHFNTLSQDKSNAVKDFLDFKNILPYYYFKRLGNSAFSMFESVMDGQDKFAFLTKQIMDFTEKTYTEEQIKEWKDTVKEFRINGIDVKMTVTQIMSLYLLSKRAQAKQHLLGGGAVIRTADKKLAKKMMNLPSGFNLTEADIVRITSTLTQEQVRVANALQKFMSDVGGKWGNEISMARFGIKMFGDPDYMPIEVDTRTLGKTEADNTAVGQTAKKASLYRLLNMSATRQLTPHANNRVVIRDLFDVFAEHMTDMAMYNSFALPILDMIKWYNYKYKTAADIEFSGEVDTAEEKIVDLSLESELANIVEGVYGSSKYKKIAQYILDVLGNKEITLSDGRLAIVDNRDAMHIANKAAPRKTAKIAKIKDIIETAIPYAQDLNADHNKFDSFLYYQANVKFGNEIFPVYLNIGKAKNDGKYHIYDITNKIKDTADRINGLERPKPNEGYALKNGISNNSVHQNSEIVNSHTENNFDDGAVTQFSSVELETALERAYGMGALKYWEDFMVDLNSAQEIGRGEEFSKKMMSNYKVAKVAFNLRVAILQPTAYIRAGNVLNGFDMTKAALNPHMIKRGIRQAEKWCGIALWKSMGYYDINIANSVADKIKHDESIRDKAVEVSLKLAEWGDKITWGALWNACEREVSRRTPELVYDSDEYNRAVAKRLREVIYSTQVVDSVLTRSDIMRSKSALTQMGTAFMSEPTVSYNIIQSAAQDIRDAKRRGERVIRKATLKRLARPVCVFVIGAVVTSIIESLPDAVRDDDDEEFGEKYLKALLSNALSEFNLLDNIPFVKEALPIMYELLNTVLDTDIAIYGSTRMDTAFIEAYTKAIRKIGGWIFDDKYDAIQAAYALLDAVSQSTGFAASNLLRDIIAIWNSTVGEIDENLKIKLK